MGSEELLMAERDRDNSGPNCLMLGLRCKVDKAWDCCLVALVNL